jgi:hypothetical protein
MKRILYTVIFLVTVISIQAQEFSELKAEDIDKEKNYGYLNYIQVNTYQGQHLIKEDLQKYFEDGFYGVSFRFGTQSTGRKEWQRLHNYPQYGIGISFFNLGNTTIDSLLGKPGSLYFFFGAPIARFGKFRFNTDLELGISHDFKPYDPEYNEFQNLIGASNNLHFNLSFQLYYEVSQRMDVGLGLGMWHFSNGRSFTPQRGINLIGLNLNTAYHYNPVKNFTKYVDPDYQPPIRPEFIVAEKSSLKKRHELIFMEAIGTVQSEPGEFKDENGVIDTTGAKGPRYMTNSFTVDYTYQFARKLKAVAGLDMFYDGSLEQSYDVPPQEVTTHQKIFYGYHIGFHYLIERFSFVANYGRYIYKPFEPRGNYFFRAGGQIGITNNFAIQICLKTRNGGIADWIEWGVAYKINSK